MADTTHKQATCPICGYTDSALDAEAIQSAMQDHLRTAHNQVMNADAASTDLKETTTARINSDDQDRIPAPAVGGNMVAPGNNLGNNRPV